MLLKILHEGLEIITEQKSVFDFLKIAWLAHNRVKRNTYCFRKNEQYRIPEKINPFMTNVPII